VSSNPLFFPKSLGILVRYFHSIGKPFALVAGFVYQSVEWVVVGIVVLVGS
jgi:hypothetical protein